jgi:hypothetical protein
VKEKASEYDLNKVCKVAIQVSESSQVMFHLINKHLPELASEQQVLMFNQLVSETSNLTQKLEDLKNVQA